MVSFYPGPSKVYPLVRDFMADAYASGVLSANHRSPEFMAVMQRTVDLLKTKQSLPDDYAVLFFSSATECWEVIAESFPALSSYHVYNGAFGEKWRRYSAKLKHSARGVPFQISKTPDPTELYKPDLICLTQNETANGTQLPPETLAAMRRHHPLALIAVDATSSMGALGFDWAQADMWFASVQKGFGLPAGLAVMFVSQRALEVALAQSDGDRHYNSLSFAYENARQLQTTHTPNTLGIYLLMRLMQALPPVHEIEKRVRLRAKEWHDFLRAHNYRLYAEGMADFSLRSETVICVKSTPEHVSYVKSEAQKAGFTLGNGYGKLKKTTFRIANFPQHASEEIEALRHCLATI